MKAEELIYKLRGYANSLENIGSGTELPHIMREAANELERVAWISDIASGVFGGDSGEMTVGEYRESKLAEKWVSVKDGLPEIYRDVLTYAEMRYGPEGVCKDIYIGHTTECGAFILDTKDRTGMVTHWQPLPPPPKE